MVWIKLVKVTALALASLLVTVAGYVAHTGIATVSVENASPDGGRILVPVPMAVAHVALAAMPDEELEELRREVGPYAPVLVTLAEELEDTPDCVLVEVIDHHNRVVIRKEGRKLRIDVTSGAERVRVKVPIRSLSRITEQVLHPGTI